MSSAQQQNENTAEQNIEIWKIKRLIKSLEAARGYVHICYLLAALALDSSDPSILATSWPSLPPLATFPLVTEMGCVPTDPRLLTLFCCYILFQ
jgi:hypothetical protein